MNDQREKILPCPFCGGINFGWMPGSIWCNNTQCAIFRKRVKPSAWNTRQAALAAPTLAGKEG